VNGEVVLLNMEQDRCYVAGRHWQRYLAAAEIAGAGFGGVEAAGTGRTSRPPGEIELDVLRTLGEFAAEGLIRVGPAS
jgi:hypothetical protein